jgi:hypothetical protein
VVKNMNKILSVAAGAAVFALAFVANTASADQSTTTAGFVCPVITTSAVLNSPNGMAIGEGHYTIIGPNVTVPIGATNGNGTGTPPGPHAAPGDANYSAIWAGQ